MLQRTETFSIDFYAQIIPIINDVSLCKLYDQEDFLCCTSHSTHLIVITLILNLGLRKN